jgi:anti-sigma-K factor RskA
MKTNRKSAKTRKIFLGFMAVMLILPFSLLAQKIPFVQSSVVPAAQGYVKIKTDRNNNNIIKISIKNLAQIERLDPAMKTYVVWMVTDRETTVNIGRIISSNNLNVAFDAVSSFKPIKIFITAEVNESAKEPGEKIVLTTDNFWK